MITRFSPPEQPEAKPLECYIGKLSNGQQENLFRRKNTFARWPAACMAARERPRPQRVTPAGATEMAMGDPPEPATALALFLQRPRGSQRSNNKFSILNSQWPILLSAFVAWTFLDHRHICALRLVLRTQPRASFCRRKNSRRSSRHFILSDVHLARLRLRDFRNYARLDAEFAPGFHLLLGDNAQGKTNVLEAIYLLATLRSFRGVGGAHLIRHGQNAYFVSGHAVGQATHEIKMYWSLRERKLSLDGQPVRVLSDYLGVLRVVVFCAEDLQLIEGTARARRRFIDLLLSQTHPTYLPVLQRYTGALRSRNALLKQPMVDEAALESFSRELVKLGQEITLLRQQLAPRLSPLVRLAYRRISREAEELRIEYQPSVKKDFAVELAQSRARERAYRFTWIGPHRDDLHLFLNERAAAQFGSEGQKRTLAIALKMAQAEYLSGLHGTPPILLIDDVMGELDRNRRSGLLPLLERSHQASGQVFLTCTEENWPRELARDWQRWQVQSGTLRPLT